MSSQSSAWLELQDRWRKACHVVHTPRPASGLDKVLGTPPPPHHHGERSKSARSSLARRILLGESKIPGEKPRPDLTTAVSYLSDSMAKDIDESIRLPHRCAFEAALNAITPRQENAARPLHKTKHAPLSFLHVAFDGCVLDTGEKFMNRPATCGAGGDETMQPIDPEFSRLLFQLSGDSQLASLRDHYREIELRDGRFGGQSSMPGRVRHDQFQPVEIKQHNTAFEGA